ncbi:DUF4190 domain-containing protein [Rhodococcoides kroppenstedtii]|uniref:DUF4190 domain-containing protein n=1 Tax=Rhodococcoides kroppenstedtii TaxID=293050 RepID=UPI003638C86E
MPLPVVPAAAGTHGAAVTPTTSAWEQAEARPAEYAWPSEPSGSQVLVAHALWFGMFVVATGLASLARVSASNYDYVLGVTAAQLIVSVVAVVIAASMVSRSGDRAAAGWASAVMVIVGILVLTYASGLSDWSSRLGWAVLSALTAFTWIVSRRRRIVVSAAAVVAIPLDLVVGYLGSALYVGGYDVGTGILVLIPVVVASWVAVVWDRLLATDDLRGEKQVRRPAPVVSTPTTATTANRPGPRFVPTSVPAVAPFGAGMNGLAIASLITGILGMGVVAVVLGHIARSQIARTGEQGAGQALAGLILGYAALVVWVVLVAAWWSVMNAMMAI